MLKAISLLETLIALVVISISILIGVLIYTTSLEGLRGPTEIQMRAKMSMIWKKIEQEKDIIEDDFNFNHFKVLKTVEKKTDQNGYEIELKGVLASDTIRNIYFLDYAE